MKNNSLNNCLKLAGALALVLFCAAAGGEPDSWVDRVASPHRVDAKRTIHVGHDRAVELLTWIDEAAGRYKGQMSREQIRAVLAAIALHESDLQANVISCEKTGDAGRAVGAYQQHLAGERRDRVCGGGLRVQTYSALAHVDALLRYRDGSATWENIDHVFSLYAGVGNHKPAREFSQLARELAGEK